jgi:hypothetical protein
MILSDLQIENENSKTLQNHQVLEIWTCLTHSEPVSKKLSSGSIDAGQASSVLVTEI